MYLARDRCRVPAAAWELVVQAVPWHVGRCWPVSEGFASSCLGWAAEAAGMLGGMGRTPNIFLKSSKRVFLCEVSE